MIVMPAKDLSTIHQLASDLFKWPSDKHEWEKYKLSDEQVDFFQRNGYLAGIKMLDDWQIKFLRQV